MSSPLRSTIILWVTLFSVVSLFHSFSFYLSTNQDSGFKSSFGDIIIIGFVLTFASIAATFLLFILQVYLISKFKQSTRNLILINAINVICGVIASFLVKEVTASWIEAFVYVGSYLSVFLVVTNFYFFKMKPPQIEDSELLDQISQ